PILEVVNGTEREQPKRKEDHGQGKWPVPPGRREESAKAVERRERAAVCGFAPENSGDEVTRRHHRDDDHRLDPALGVVDLGRRILTGTQSRDKSNGDRLETET